MTGDRAAAAALLGIAPDAPPQAVRLAFARAARRSHPDLMPDADAAERAAAEARFDRLVRARDLLMQPRHVPPVARDVPPRAAHGPGLGFSLVVLALLGFLLIGLAGIEVALHS